MNNLERYRREAFRKVYKTKRYYKVMKKRGLISYLLLSILFLMPLVLAVSSLEAGNVAVGDETGTNGMTIVIWAAIILLVLIVVSTILKFKPKRRAVEKTNKSKAKREAKLKKRKKRR